MLLVSFLTRAMHISLSVSLLNRGLCGRGVAPEWMVRHRQSGKIVALDHFFKNEVVATRLILFGTTSTNIPPQSVVTTARTHHWKFVYPSSDKEAVVTGAKGAATHQRRHSDMSPGEYAKLCRVEDAVAMDLRDKLVEEPSVVAIVPNQFIVHDSLPSRLRKMGVKTQQTTTLTDGGGGFVGDYILVSATCESSS